MANKKTKTQQESSQRKEIPSPVDQLSKPYQTDMSLIIAGIVAVILSLISNSGLMAENIFEVNWTLLFVVGIIAIVAGVILQLRRKNKQ